MLSFRRLEAAFWAARLGSFAAAADKLYTSESAISKRITELEAFLGHALFDRSRRRVRLTRQGGHFIDSAEELLRQRDRLLASVGKESSQVRRFRVGVTELVALTWLPQLLQQFQMRYPDTSFEPEIDLSTDLFSKLEEGTIDLVIVPPIFSEDRVCAVPLKELHLTWMCKPGLIPSDESPRNFEDITQYPILVQMGRSGVDLVYQEWFKSKQARIRRIYAGNSLVSLAALTIAGFGISYLPSLYFRELAHKGILEELSLVEPGPDIRYYAVYRRDDPIAGFSAQIADLCVHCCDFSKPTFSAIDIIG